MRNLLIGLLFAVALLVTVSPASATCTCIGDDQFPVSVDCGGSGGDYHVNWVPCASGVTVCTYDEAQLSSYLQDCCQSCYFSSVTGCFDNCMIGKGGWFCGTCP